MLVEVIGSRLTGLFGVTLREPALFVDLLPKEFLPDIFLGWAAGGVAAGGGVGFAGELFVVEISSLP